MSKNKPTDPAISATLDSLDWTRNTNPRLGAATFYTLGHFHPATRAFFTRHEMREALERTKGNEEDFAPLLAAERERRLIRLCYRIAVWIAIGLVCFVIGVLSACCPSCSSGVCPYPQTAIEKVPGFYMQSECRVTYAAGMDTGISVPDPTDDDGEGRAIWIPPGAVAAWGDPIPLPDLDCTEPY